MSNLPQCIVIVCPTAIAAGTLHQVLTNEGHDSVWYLNDRDEPTVATTAPVAAVLACCQSAETLCGYGMPVGPAIRVCA